MVEQRASALSLLLLLGCIGVAGGKDAANAGGTPAATGGSGANATGGGSASGGGGSASGGGSSGQLVATVRVTPEAGNTVPKGTLQFTAMAVDQHGNAVAGARTYAWSVPAVAGTISSSGLFTAADMTGGPYEVSATSEGIKGTAAVTVSMPSQGCTAAPIGVWENITPQQLKPELWCQRGTCHSDATHIETYGAHGMGLSASAPGTLIFGTDALGIWRTTECGAQSSWENISDDGGELGNGRQWTVAVDPADARVIYTTSGYSMLGVYKTVDGGKTWKQMLPPGILAVTGNGFVEKITLDPTPVTGRTHVLVSFHSPCTGTPASGAALDSQGHWGCLAESFDSGEHWHLTTAALPWEGLDGPGQAMLDATTWFYASNSSEGLWKTTTAGISVDGGSAWYRVINGGVGGSVYAAPSGVLYSSGQYSTDQGEHWTQIPNHPAMYSLNGSNPIVQADSTLYVASGFFDSKAYSAPVLATGAVGTFGATPYGQGVTTGGFGLDYDPTYHVVYSYNMVSGLWRLRLQ
jgi:hypothetical protein